MAAACCCILSCLEHFVVLVLALALLGAYLRGGTREILRLLILGIKQIPGLSGLLGSVLKSESASFLNSTNLAPKAGENAKIVLPKKGLPREKILEKLDEMRAKETDHLEGKVFAYTYTLNDDHFELQKEVYEKFTEKIGYSPDHDELVKYFQKAFLHENGLNPMIYPSLRQMEVEVVSMTCAMLNGDAQAVGFLTSGGTESVIMAVRAYRNRAEQLFPWIKEPEIICPVTQHPVIGKAAHYFGMKVIYVDVGPDFRADVQAMEKAITPNTVMVACSAPQFCHGIVDPVEEVSNMAARHGLPCHVDACFGGFMLPWVEKLGYDVPTWDFRCPGVTSISADVHKYGYTVKGASVIAYRNEDLRKYQIYSFSSWPGGLYGSPSLAGSRPGGNIAAAWAALNSLGEEGYMARAKILMDITDRIKAGIQSIEGIKIMGNPHMTCMAFGSNHPDLDILVVADLMEKKGWVMERQQNPTCLHCSILPHHNASCDALIDDLRESAKLALGNKELSKKGKAGIYGMMAAIPDQTIVEDFIKQFFSDVYKVQK
ncbi:sphingosine-1-phosphate lyase [Biomphalaria pfeifferi]|uniref:sphinganine-1-phosphate aldolase n=1 Tax=Biomphalaria pfeifferi TaxID=112525 RepID=A0AAD8C5B1_BIOPF|nr:sphingosine-1-phosphate lyase [Biomphalaria pfeifferi]